MTFPFPPTKATDPQEILLELIKRYTILTSVPDIERYRRITTPREGHCVFRGCPEPIAWEDANGTNFLCEGHYRTIVQWVEETRREYLRR